MSSTIEGYLPLVILTALGIGTIFAILALVNFLTPRRPTPEKLRPYECGETPVGDPRVPIDIKYYIYVLVFLVLDVEVVFLIPWAVELRRLGGAALIEMVIFILLLLAGWGYAWKRGVLRWLR